VKRSRRDGDRLKSLNCTIACLNDVRLPVPSVVVGNAGLHRSNAICVETYEEDLKYISAVKSRAYIIIRSAIIDKNIIIHLINIYVYKMKRKCIDLFKCVRKPTKSRLSLTYHANKSSR